MFGEKELLKEAFDALFGWVKNGTLKVAKVTEYKLSDVGSAHRALESGNTVGKLVLLTQEQQHDTNINEGKNKEENGSDEKTVQGENAEDNKLL